MSASGYHVPTFEAWPKTPRWYRDIVITEKIDGTNGGILIEQFPYGEFTGTSVPPEATLVVGTELDEWGSPLCEYLVVAQSRKRICTPDRDNAGFARWVWDNAYHLVEDLGTGRHFGEWWGQGIQRNYGMDHKEFSLFNTGKWTDDGWMPRVFKTERLGVVPVIYNGPLDGDMNGDPPIEAALNDLVCDGSYVADGWMKPEGICIYHTASNQVYKVTLENDGVPKGLAA